MKKYPGTTPAKPGVFQGEIEFSNPTLRDYRWPVYEIAGRRAGPKLCVTAGVHVNEVSSIEAAIRLQRLFDPEVLRGSVSIIPVVNLPALYSYTEYTCPVDGKNINFTFPGDPNGTFSEALCHALVTEWAGDADCYIDLHGGDLRETVSKFVMFQRTGDTAGDTFRRSLAECFDADLVVGFAPPHMDAPGRPPTAFARLGRNAIMSEGGANGIVDEDSVAYHVGGVLNVARKLGMIDGPLSPPKRAQVLCHDYIWTPAPVDGLFYSEIRPFDAVREGDAIGEFRSLFGERLATLRAPATGYVLWRVTQPILREGAAVLAIAVPAAEPR